MARARKRYGNPARAAAAMESRDAVRPLRPRDWVRGARLRTLPLAFAPVIAGVGVALQAEGFQPIVAALTLLVAVALQVGVNFANDYSDGIRGTDARRVGPARLTASGRVAPRVVLRVALVCFAIAALAGVAVVVLSEQWLMLGVGALAIVAAWFYTGGSRPYGYAGFGELAVFVFFGIVATAGTVFVQLGELPGETWIAAVSLGMFAVAAILVNNIRDAKTDREAGKRTLAVRIGDRAARILCAVMLIAPFGVSALTIYLLPEGYLIGLVALIALPAVLIVLTAKTPRELILVLQLSTLASLGYAVAFAVASLP